tara:strand:- start:525 stop:692 length:168 start_codon:yes stop_codon:yes gene_type:complete
MGFWKEVALRRAEEEWEKMEGRCHTCGRLIPKYDESYGMDECLDCFFERKMNKDD